MDASIAIAVADEQLAARGNGQVRRVVKWPCPLANRAEVDARRPGIRRLARRAERGQEPPLGRELANAMSRVVGAIDRVVGSNADPVRPREQTFAPRADEGAILVEDHDRMVAAVENKNPIAAVDGNR